MQKSIIVLNSDTVEPKLCQQSGIPESQNLKFGKLHCALKIPHVMMVSFEKYLTGELKGYGENPDMSRRGTSPQHSYARFLQLWSLKRQ